MGEITKKNIEIRGYASPDFTRILSNDALEFVSSLHRKFNQRRMELLERRAVRQRALENGDKLTFLSETKHIREDDSWRVATTPPDLQKRYVEITGPVERKMIINAMNSGANTFMADFEDSLSPTWTNVIEGQINLMETVSKTISLKTPDGKQYSLNEKTAVLLVRPRGWHLSEKHVIIDDEAISASLFDFGLYFFHNAKALIAQGSGPYFYLPKMESHLEARLWNDVFVYAQEALKLPVGTIKATVLIETIMAAFEMEEILYELRDHSAGLNAGRWDYIFSIIKKFRFSKEFVFPDRAQITMTVPFMKAYAKLLVNTCHRRSAHAIGGMAAFIPSRRDAEVNERALEQVRSDKLRESKEGFDGTWVAHPDLVPVAGKIFEEALKGRPHQKGTHIVREEVLPEQLLDFNIANAGITEAGVRKNISVTLQYLESWLHGIGAVALHNLMEDAATAEISRSQLWQWVHSLLGVTDNGERIDASYFRRLLKEESEILQQENAKEHIRLCEAKKLLEMIVCQERFDDFLTIPAYELLV